MKIAQTVAGILKDHVTLGVEGIDRMYLICQLIERRARRVSGS
jgi:hypothetical protein